ncbi:conserved hypothetical protein [Ricinus communis]|uniref:Uncharacterized protein n=1 Tax=Ricinus communis TaxID=3988 RepID=B9T4X9_RICCO|nr:conserved hypothetical protein [Ricinus communis]
MAVAENTRLQEMKKFEESLTDMVKGMLQEHMKNSKNLLGRNMLKLSRDNLEREFTRTRWLTLRATHKLDNCKSTLKCLMFYHISCFLCGLKGEICIPLRMFGPKTLQKAYTLARLQESYLTATRTKKSYYNKTFLPSSSTQAINQTKPALPLLLPIPRTRRLKDAEINNKRAKNLCFWCDDKFHRSPM